MNSIQEKFKKRKRNQFLMVITWFIAMFVIIFILTLDFMESMPNAVMAIGIVMVVMLFGFAIFTFINWRCPKCNKSLGKGVPKVYEFCGEELVCTSSKKLNSDRVYRDRKE